MQVPRNTANGIAAEGVGRHVRCLIGCPSSVETVETLPEPELADGLGGLAADLGGSKFVVGDGDAKQATRRS